jgi:TolA-binding protein
MAATQSETGMMTNTTVRATGTFTGKRPLRTALAMALAIGALPALLPAPARAQQATPGESTEARLRRLEAEVRALQRKVFPDGAGRAFGPEITAPATPAPTPAPAQSPLTDVLSRIDAVEAQLRQLTATTEENQNHLSKLDTRVDALEAAATPAPTATPAAGTDAAPLPATTPAPGKPAPRPAGQATPDKSATPAPAPAKPSPDRIAAVAAIAKPSTADKADDEYTYGFRLYDAKFYPEAQVQLTKFVEGYPKSKRISFARNLLGRAYLDDGKPGTAAQWFLQNYLGDKQGERAADSLLYLGVAMTRINDTKRACGAFAELRDSYPADIGGRLKGAYETAVKGVKCN